MPTDMYVRFGNNIKGECEHKPHKDWSEITHIKQDFQQKASPGEDDSETDASKATHSEITIKKITDSASPDLMKACWAGTVLDKVVIEFFRAAGGTPVKYLNIVLEKTVIKKFEYEGNEGEMMTDEVELTAGKITFTYRAMDKRTGAQIGKLLASHDLRSNVIG